MRDFTYHRPGAISAASELFGKADEPRFVAGGMSLLPSMKLRLAAPSDLIDLGDIETLRGISVSGSQVRVGAMTPHAEVAASADVRKAIPALADLANGIGDPAVRHRGTLGGSIANADPAACYPAAVIGLDAVVETNMREIAADDFFTGLFSTALEDGEIVTAVRFKVPEKAAYQKLRHPASGFAVTGVMVARFGTAVRVAVTGAGPSVFRPAAIETALAADFSAKALDGVTIPDDELMSDIHFSAAYRANAAVVLARRAVASLT